MKHAPASRLMLLAGMLLMALSHGAQGASTTTLLFASGQVAASDGA